MTGLANRFPFRRPGAIFLALGLLFLASCSTEPPPPAAGSRPVHVDEPASDQQPIPAGKVFADSIGFEFAAYFLPKPQQDPEEVLQRLLKEKFTDFQRVAKIDDSSKDLTLAARLEADPREHYAPPDAESLHRFGRGVDPDQAAALQETEGAFLLDFHYSADHVWDGLRQASEIVEALARDTGGLIWDETTREVFSPDVWHEKRLADWDEGVPNVSRHTVIHAYQSGEFIRAITLGMEKFGLPDVIVDGFSWSVNRNVGHTINLFAQAIAEGLVVGRDGEFDLDLRKIRNPEVREPQVSTLKENATGIALLTIREGRREEGDPANRLVEITFDRGTGPDRHARREQVLISAFGSEDSVTAVKHDEALEAASGRAKAKLPALRAAVENGLAPGEYIMVKAPFSGPEGGREWMWVEVSEWNGKEIRGLLQNEPFQIPDLHAGQMVAVQEDEVFDYLRKFPDGKTEGNETGKLIEQQRE